MENYVEGHAFMHMSSVLLFSVAFVLLCCVHYYGCFMILALFSSKQSAKQKSKMQVSVFFLQIRGNLKG